MATNTIIERGRFSSAIWYERAKNSDVIVAGAGGIGSWVAMLLSRLGCRLIIIDDDTVENHNLGGQLFTADDINLSKVEAVGRQIRNFSRTSATLFTDRITPENVNGFRGPIIFSCFDNMLARKILFDSWRKAYAGTGAEAIFIDGRLEPESCQILAIKANDLDSIMKYEREFLFSDSEVEEAVCTYKQTSHSAALIASHMVATLVNYFSNLATRSEERTVPFYWDFYNPLMYSTPE